MKLNMALDIADSSSAIDWVKHSRLKEKGSKEHDKLLAELKQRQLEEEEEELIEQSRPMYTATDLKGLKVMHSSEYFEEGQEVILTLADTNLLDVDEEGKIIGLNDEQDVLENVRFADKDRQIDRENKKRKLNQPIYSALDDYEFQEGVVPGTRAPILQQYDKEKKQMPKFELGANGVAKLATQLDRPLSMSSASNVVHSLQSSMKEANDFYSSSEYTQFVKSKKTGHDKKKRNTRKKDTNDIEERDDTINGSIQAIDMIVDDVEQSGSSSSSSNNNIKKSAEELMKKVPPPMKFNSIDLDDDDPDLALSLARSRRLALQKQAELNKMDRNSMISSSVDDRGATIARSLAEKSRRLHDDTNHRNINNNNNTRDRGDGFDVEAEDDDIDVDGRRANGTLVFNSTTEFSTKLQARINEKARMKTEALMKGLEQDTGRDQLMQLDTTTTTKPYSHAEEEEDADDALSMNSTGDGQHSVSKLKVRFDIDNNDVNMTTTTSFNADMSDIDDDEDDEELEQAEEENVDVDDEQLAFVHRQPLASKGMAATLALLKGSGELKKSDELAGRAKDERQHDPSSGDMGVKLEYRDEFGRKLTQKEAFRQLSYRFHGYGPGKKKSEKRLKVLYSLLSFSIVSFIIIEIYYGV